MNFKGTLLLATFNPDGWLALLLRFLESNSVSSAVDPLKVNNRPNWQLTNAGNVLQQLSAFVDFQPTHNAKHNVGYQYLKDSDCIGVEVQQINKTCHVWELWSTWTGGSQMFDWMQHLTQALLLKEETHLKNRQKHHGTKQFGVHFEGMESGIISLLNFSLNVNSKSEIRILLQ